MGQPRQDTSFVNTKGSTSKSAPVTVVNRLAYAAAVTFTRPANATPYVTKDVIGKADSVTPANAGSAILEFADIGPVGGVIEITGSDFRVDRADIPEGMGSFTAHLFDAAPVAVLDNATFVLTSDTAKYLGFIDVGAPAIVGGALFVQKDLKKQVKLAATSSSLFVVIVTEGGHIPGASIVHALRLQTRTAA